MANSINRRSYIKEIILIVCIVAFAGIMLYTLFGPEGLKDLQKARIEMQERQERVDALEDEIKKRTRNADAIDEDALRSGRPETLDLLERRAREQGYAREGEYIQRILD